VKFVWAVVGLLYAALSIYVGWLFVTTGTSAKLAQKGLLLQAPPILGGVALVIVALPLIWNCFRLATARTPRY
jgi:hypothetical protein